MAEHTHGCLKCRPEMVPDFDRDDERYHHHEKCGRLTKVTLDGDVRLLTNGTFEGPEGWVLFAGATSGDVHNCSCDLDSLCVEPRFGQVEVIHECPAVTASRERQIQADIAEARLWRSRFSLVGEQGPELIRPGRTT